MKRLFTIALSVLMVTLMVALCCINAFAINRINDGIVYDPENPDEIPLLIISASFDANGNGINDFDPNDERKLYSDTSKDYFGEQWASLSADAYYDDFFGNGKSVANFYKEMTLGKLYFVPLQFDVDPETTKNPGCINVVVHQMHPSAGQYNGYDNGTYAGMSIKNIIKATDPYIDYSKLDKNGDGILSQHELLIVIMNAGYSQESSGISDRNPNQPRNYYAVWSTSQGVSISMDGVTFQSTNGSGNVTNMGEYLSPGKRQLVGTACHELCHNLGAEDIYARKVGATGSALTPWPFVNNFSLQCNGNYSSGGASPTYLDPYQRIYLGWADEVVVGEGEYTLYSTCTGKYQVLRVNTPDPDEYYLIELRLKEGFEVGLTSGSAKGGIVVWHIDESSNRKYFTSGTACSNYMFDGAYHDPGIVVCHPYNSTLKGIPNQTPSSDAFFHADATSKYNKEFNSMDYKSPLGGTTGTVCGLNSYPTGWIGEQYWNLKVVPLDPAGQEMRIQISIESKGMVAPTATVNSTTASGTTVSVKGSIEESTLTYTSMGFEIATNVGFSDNYQKVEVNSFDDTGVFTGLLENKTYRVRSFAVTDSGTIYSQPKLVKTGADPKVNVNFVDGEATNTVVVKVGETVAEPEAPTKVGYTFGGWYTDNTFKTKYDFSTVLTESGEISLYANWIEDKPEETTQATQATEATTEASKPSSGCKSIVGSTGIVTLAVTLVGYAVVRKKKED